MKKYLRNLARTIVIIFFFYSYMAYAQDEVDFSDPETVEQLITGKTWHCKMVDAYGESTGIYTFKSVSGKKVKGSVRVPHLPVCDSDILKGKLKKNKLKYMAPNGTPCREVNGNFEFNITESGEVEAKGTYGIGGTHKRGSYVCSMQN